MNHHIVVLDLLICYVCYIVDVGSFCAFACRHYYIWRYRQQSDQFVFDEYLIALPLIEILLFIFSDFEMNKFACRIDGNDSQYPIYTIDTVPNSTGVR